MRHHADTARDRRCARICAVVLSLLSAILAPGIEAAEEPLTLGVFPRRNYAETARLFGPMVDHLSERLGRKVNLVTSRNFDTFWKAVKEQRYDIVHYNQYHYIRSAQSYQVIAHIEELGKSTISGVIYVRKDSGITHIGQLRGRTVMFGGGEDAMISYIANRHLFLQAGVRKNEINPLFAVNPPNAILALSRHQAAAAGAGDGVLELPAVKSAINTDELTALAMSEPLLQLPIAVRRDMPSSLRASIQSILVDLKNNESGRRVLNNAFMTGIGLAEDKDYAAHRKMAQAVFGTDGPESDLVLQDRVSSGPKR